MKYELRNNIIFKFVQASWAFFLDLLFPRECFSCSREGDWLCEECFRKLKNKETQYCFHCRGEDSSASFCENCRDKYYLDGVWIAGDYEEVMIAKLIKSFKYSFIEDLSLILGKYLALFLRDTINKSKLNNESIMSPRGAIIMPIPLHKKRLRWRGFNQSEYLAREVAGYFGSQLETVSLVRTRHKKAQAKLGKAERASNIKNCFSWRGEVLHGKNIILIDDVATTGSTLNECARVLKESGAEKVWGLVIARG